MLEGITMIMADRKYSTFLLILLSSAHKIRTEVLIPNPATIPAICVKL